MEHYKYEILIRWSNEDTSYVAKVTEIKYCMAHGATYQEALDEIEKAIDLYVQTAKENNKQSILRNCDEIT